MIQCTDCEFFRRLPDDAFKLACDPFSNIKEPECLIKWQLLKLNAMVDAYEATVEFYQRLAPMQEKMFRHMEQEMDEIDDADAWKQGYQDDEEQEEDDDRVS